MDNERHYLHTLFEPESIAVIGASETANSIGVTLVRNMLDSGYKGKLFFVNPKHETVFGQPSYASVGTIPQRLDIAVICTDAAAEGLNFQFCGALVNYDMPAASPRPDRAARPSSAPRWKTRAATACACSARTAWASCGRAARST